MLLNINKIIGSVIVLSMLLTACSNNKEGDVKNTAETKTETTAIAEETKTSSQTGDSQYFMALAYEQQSNYSTYITLSSQPLNNTLTKYRDTYPNIIGFTAKTQSGLNSLCNDYKTNNQENYHVSFHISCITSSRSLLLWRRCLQALRQY